MEKLKEADRQPDLYVFDICDTLFYSNTTFDFIKFVLKEKKWKMKQMQLKVYTKKASPIFIGLYLLQSFTKIDWPKRLCLKLLQGLSKAELYHLGIVFEQKILASRLIKQTHDMLASLKKGGNPIFLISASIDPVVAAIANTLEVNFKCSELNYNSNGIFTGNLKKEMTGQKLAELRKILSDQGASFAVITDNLSDRGLVEAACQRYVVVYNEKSRAFWQDLNPNFIDLSS